MRQSKGSLTGRWVVKDLVEANARLVRDTWATVKLLERLRELAE